MLSRTAFRSAARLASRQPAAFSLARVAAVQNRSAATTSSAATSQDEAYSILVDQRKKRPVAPHLTIYQPQLTWYMSGLTRITGVTISGVAYIFGISYAVAPLFGWHMESASVAAAFGALPTALNVGIKGFLALPFSYHCWNGVRHLTWDTGKALDIKNVYRTGYTVIGLTAVSTIALMFM